MKTPIGIQLEHRLREESVVPADATATLKNGGPAHYPGWTWHVAWGDGQYAGSHWPMEQCVKERWWKISESVRGDIDIEPAASLRDVVRHPPKRRKPKAARTSVTVDAPVQAPPPLREIPPVEPGQVWVGFRSEVVGRTVQIEQVMDNDRISYAVLSKAYGKSRANPRGSIRVNSLRYMYQLQEAAETAAAYEQTLEELVAEARKYAAPVCADAAEDVVRKAYRLGGKQP